MLDSQLLVLIIKLSEEKTIMSDIYSKFTFEKEGMQGLCNALVDDDPRLRQMAALFLGTTKNDKIVGNLIAALHDREKNVRARSMEALVCLGGVAVDSLIVSLGDDDWVVRYRSAEALGRIGDERACEPLLATLQDEKDHVRHMAAKGLGFFSRGDLCSYLIPLLTDENEFVRKSAAISIGRIGGDESCVALKRALDHEDDPGVCEAIKTAITEACR